MARYLIADLRTGDVLAIEETLDLALVELGERKTDYFGEGWDLVSAPDYGVIDDETSVMWDDQCGEVVRHWWDAFGQCWRIILELESIA